MEILWLWSWALFDNDYVTARAPVTVTSSATSSVLADAIARSMDRTKRVQSLYPVRPLLYRTCTVARLVSFFTPIATSTVWARAHAALVPFVAYLPSSLPRSRASPRRHVLDGAYSSAGLRCFSPSTSF
ncbi:hypothetical protein EXIGLDRAFT_832097 [Exidia glandulosa HHB12029]|uniref:Uncharacterized protein n=1 Tax=Exidia glandulosa HHB12029 TaxID=1314781 RepID=A0A166B7B9_EXIGL|nr:hypothetical protein EXIGLDRAFT_832097 [Exidia glandulosa HHB12029]